MRISNGRTLDSGETFSRSQSEPIRVQDSSRSPTGSCSERLAQPRPRNQRRNSLTRLRSLVRISTSTAEGVAEADIFRTHRRYLTAKSRKSRRLGTDHYLALDSKRRLMPGTDIPTSFPSRAALDAAGYWAMEDLQGATTTELKNAGLSSPEAAAVLAALEVTDV